MRELNEGEEKIIEDNCFIQFTEKLLGIQTYPKHLFVRECYTKLYSLVDNWFNNDKVAIKVVLVRV